MNKYELVLVLPGSLDADLQNELSKKLKQTITSVGGVVVKENDWGTKHLAYPVKHEQSGHYFSWDLELSGSAVREMRRLLNFETKLLRYLLLQVDKK